MNNQDDLLLHVIGAAIISTTVGLYLVFHKNSKVSKCGCYIIFLGLILFLAPLWITGFAAPVLTKFWGIRLNLLAYPIFYFVSDSIIFLITNRKQFKLGNLLADSLPLDLAILLVGSVTYIVGLRINDPLLFFAGSSATILILGNSFYVIHKYRTQSRKMNNEKSWHSWSRTLWKEAEGGWINRNGQDYFYRQQVILPAIKNKLRCLGMIQSVIDLGSGDGYTLNELLDDQSLPFSEDVHITIIDLSRKQLTLAEKLVRRNEKLLKTQARNVRVNRCDLNDEKWTLPTKQLPSPRVFLNVFVLQEMFSIHYFFSNISKVLEKDDLLLTIVVAPTFAQHLSKRKAGMVPIGKDADLVKDWDWAAMYPISTPQSTIYLPYFHRTIGNYRAVIGEHGLCVDAPEYLKVPDNTQARTMFRDTAYKENIVGIDSSVLMCIRRKQ